MTIARKLFPNAVARIKGEGTGYALWKRHTSAREVFWDMTSRTVWITIGVLIAIAIVAAIVLYSGGGGTGGGGGGGY